MQCQPAAGEELTTDNRARLVAARSVGVPGPLPPAALRKGRAARESMRSHTKPVKPSSYMFYSW